MARLPQRELTPDDIKGRQPDPIDLGEGADLSVRSENIELVDRPITTDYAASLAFAEEMVTIRLERNSEKFQAPLYQFSVNGRTWWIPVNKPWQVPRKVVEVIARSQPFTCTTEVGDTRDENPRNILHRYQSAKYPFSVLHDPNPAGPDWLRRIALEA